MKSHMERLDTMVPRYLHSDVVGKLGRLLHLPTPMYDISDGSTYLTGAQVRRWVSWEGTLWIAMSRQDYRPTMLECQGLVIADVLQAAWNNALGAADGDEKLVKQTLEIRFY